MRIFRKIFEDSKIVRYEYLYNDSKRPFTGLVEIDKELASKRDPACIKVIKPADKEWSPERKLPFSVVTLINKKYPKHYTHTAI
ncbi:MAG: hypothetical protein IIW49_08895 [Treponema sp.]|nr:hypothetical protein [Treponema sp.]MBQ5877110.1 hypothetical protein [Treponema sp.]